MLDPSPQVSASPSASPRLPCAPRRAWCCLGMVTPALQPQRCCGPPTVVKERYHGSRRHVNILGGARLEPGCNLTVEVAVLLTLYVALTAAYPDSAWKTLRRQLCRK